MVFEPMTRQELSAYLLNAAHLAECLQSRTRDLKQEMERLEECLERNPIERKSYENELREDGVSRGIFRDSDPVQRMLAQPYQDLEEEIKEMEKQMILLEKETKKLRYIRNCFRRLPLQEAELLEELYIKGLSWQEYGRKHYMSRATVFRNRKRALDDLLVLYHCGDSLQPDNLMQIETQ